MRSAILVMLLPALCLAAEIKHVEGKDLPVVPGPLTGTEPMRDPLPRFGLSRMDLDQRRACRQGLVPAVAVPPGDVAIAHAVTYPAGWQAYKVEALPGEQIKARLRGDHEAWFLVRCVNRQGLLQKGMLQNLIGTGNPEASFRNLGKDTATVFFVVDTTELATGQEPYTLTFTRVAAVPTH